MRIILLFLFSLTLLKTLLTTPDTTVLPVDPPDPIDEPIIIVIYGMPPLSPNDYFNVVRCDKPITTCKVTLSELPLQKAFGNEINMRHTYNNDTVIETVIFHEASNTNALLFEDLSLWFSNSKVKFEN